MTKRVCPTGHLMDGRFLNLLDHSCSTARRVESGVQIDTRSSQKRFAADHGTCGALSCAMCSSATRQLFARFESSHRYEGDFYTHHAGLEGANLLRPALIHSRSAHCALTCVLASSESVLIITGRCRDETGGIPRITSQGLMAGPLL